MHADCGLEFETVYFGGGTPSSLGARVSSRLSPGCESVCWFVMTRGSIWRVNPEDVTPENSRVGANLGVRFVSLGVQSFDDRDLAFLGRRHGAHERPRQPRP